jgi:serine/threonine protein kinase
MDTIEKRGNAPLGKGSYGTVYDCIYSNGTREHAGAFKKNKVNKPTDFHCSVKELDVLVQMKGHHHIVSLTKVVFGEVSHDFCLSPVSNSGMKPDLVHFTFEKASCSGDELLYVRHPFYQAASVTKIATHVLLGLEYLHAHKIIHRDIKPGNILYFESEDVIKISDFGMCRRMNKQRPPTPGVCTMNYRAPEIILGQSYNEKSDIWSWGCMIYEFLTNNFFLKIRGKESTEKLITAIRKKLNTNWERDLPEEFVPLLQGALQQDPKKRLTATELLALIPQRYQEEIQQCREDFPPIFIENKPYLMALRDERTLGAEILQTLFSSRFKSRTLFHAWRLFDSCIYHLPDEEVYERNMVEMILYVCIYLMEKYFATLTVVSSWDHMVPSRLRGEKNRKLALFIERQIIKDLYEMCIYEMTAFEAADDFDINLSTDEAIKLLTYISTHDVSGLTASEIVKSYL